MWSAIRTKDYQQLDQYLGSIKKKKNLQLLLQSRNEQGNTPLLEAASLRHSASINKIISVLMAYSGGVGLNLQDLESGYTALHKCLLKGQLKTALLILQNSTIDYNVKDNEGMTFLEMLDASIKLPKINAAPIFVLESELHPPPELDDSAVSASEHDLDESLDCTGESLLRRFQDPSASMSLWSWGSNSNYLLGHSLADSRLFPELVKISSRKPPDGIAFEALLDEDPQIVQVVMSKYHVALLTKTCLYTYGFGRGGRLGHGNEDTVMSPKIVEGFQCSIATVALGADHTMAITTDGRVWTWGSNRHSQLGYSTPQSEQALIPQCVSLKKTVASGAAAGKFHSAIFTSSGAVFTWGTNNGQLGYDGPVQAYPRRITSFPNQEILQIAATNNATIVLTQGFQITAFVNNEIVKLALPVAAAPAITRLSSFRQPHPTKITSGDSDIAILLSSGDVCMWTSVTSDDRIGQPRKIWRARKKNRIGIDCCVGVDSSIVVATESGHVFVSTKRPVDGALQPKFQRVPHLEHIISVAASSGGSFAAIRSDFRCPQPLDIVPSLETDLKRALSNRNRSDYDFFFVVDDGSRLGAHAIVLSSRSAFFKTLLANGKMKHSSLWSYQEATKTLHLEQVCLPALDLVLEFLYTGSFQQPWNNGIFFSIAKATNPELVQIHSGFTKLAKLFGLDETELLQATLSQSQCKVGASILPNKDNYSNVVVALSDGQVVSHSLLLSARCPYFRAILGTHNSWVCRVFQGTSQVVNLAHMSRSVFQVILGWIISDSPLLFGAGTKFASLEDWLEFVAKVLVAADELLLPKIVAVCSSILSRFLTIRNVLGYLELGMTYCASSLCDACLDFIVRNIETFLKNSALKESHDDIITALEAKLQYLQKQKLPHMLGAGGYYEQLLELEKQFLRDRKTDGRKLMRSTSQESTHSYVGSSTTSLAPSPLFSPTVRESASTNTLVISPLLVPLNTSFSVSPLMTPARSADIASSMEDLSLDSAWTETKSRSIPKLYGESPKSLDSSMISMTEMPSPFLVRSEAEAFSPLPGSHSALGSGIQMVRQMKAAVGSLRSESAGGSPSGRSPGQSAASQEPIVIPIKRCIPSSPSSYASKSQLSTKLSRVSNPSLRDTPELPDHGIPIKFGTKLSQRERKRLYSQGSSPATAETLPKESSRASSTPWAIPIPTVKVGLDCIQKEEEKNKINSMSLESPSKAAKWNVTPPVLTLSSPKVSLRNIQEQQAQDKAALQKERSKTIAQIQAEETALQELTNFYKDTRGSGTGEWTTFRRRT
ncbi:hypothetical protein HDU91_000445 [Kappamyces sp. JEL0680]|nr:hypothetical protein HDU91_000445 [Kappamyces sp. JEL0680]